MAISVLTDDLIDFINEHRSGIWEVERYGNGVGFDMEYNALNPSFMIRSEGIRIAVDDKDSRTYDDLYDALDKETEYYDEGYYVYDVLSSSDYEDLYMNFYDESEYEDEDAFVKEVKAEYSDVADTVVGAIKELKKIIKEYQHKDR